MVDAYRDRRFGSKPQRDQQAVSLSPAASGQVIRQYISAVLTRAGKS